MIYLFSATCNLVKCSSGQHCVEDQNSMPHCVSCFKQCSSQNSQNLSTKKLVCGADGNTYRSLCEIKQKACMNGRAIPVAYRGPCSGKILLYLFLFLHNI